MQMAPRYKEGRRGEKQWEFGSTLHTFGEGGVRGVQGSFKEEERRLEADTYVILDAKCFGAAAKSCVTRSDVSAVR